PARASSPYRQAGRTAKGALADGACVSRPSAQLPIPQLCPRCPQCQIHRRESSDGYPPPCRIHGRRLPRRSRPRANTHGPHRRRSIPATNRNPDAAVCLTIPTPHVPALPRHVGRHARGGPEQFGPVGEGSLQYAPLPPYRLQKQSSKPSWQHLAIARAIDERHRLKLLISPDRNLTKGRSCSAARWTGTRPRVSGRTSMM
ncbi:hypothetical protein B0H17DRAFT_1298856, partial [Mycena rosella]